MSEVGRIAVDEHLSLLVAPNVVASAKHRLEHGALGKRRSKGLLRRGEDGAADVEFDLIDVR